MQGDARFGGRSKWICLALIGALSFPGCSDEPASGPSHPAGSAGDSSSCHASRDPAPRVLAPSALDPHTVALAAAVYGSCVPDDGVTRNAAYWWSGQASNGKMYYRTQLQLECLAHSACGCSALEHCLGYAYGPSSDCQPGCVGDVFTGCGSEVDLQEGYRASFDCQSLGLYCDPKEVCTDGAKATCDASFLPRCNAAGQPEVCENGLVRHGPTCAALGLDCAGGGCVGRGASCDSSGLQSETVRWHGVSCSGATLSACVGGKLASVDCSGQGPGFGCQHVADDYFCGLAAECDPPNDSGTSTRASCNGSTLEFCNAGRLEHIDCLSLGFTGCDLSEPGHFGCIPGISL